MSVQPLWLRNKQMTFECVGMTVGFSVYLGQISSCAVLWSNVDVTMAHAGDSNDTLVSECLSRDNRVANNVELNQQVLFIIIPRISVEFLRLEHVHDAEFSFMAPLLRRKQRSTKESLLKKKITTHTWPKTFLPVSVSVLFQYSSSPPVTKNMVNFPTKQVTFP